MGFGFGQHLAPEVGVLEVECLLRAVLRDEARLREGALADLLLGRRGAPLEDLVRARVRVRLRVRVRVRVRLRVRVRVRVRVGLGLRRRACSMLSVEKRSICASCSAVKSA